METEERVTRDASLLPILKKYSIIYKEGKIFKAQKGGQYYERNFNVYKMY